MEFKELHEAWLRYDVPECWLYQNLLPEDREEYWTLIEKKYLCKYRLILRLEFEWSSSCLWSPKYPGGVGISGPYEPGELGFSVRTSEELDRWIDFVDREIGLRRAPDNVHRRASDWALELGKQIVCELPSDVYFERRPLRQLVCLDHAGVELDYDPEINALLKIEGNPRWLV